MAAKMLPVVKLATKVGIAGGAMYVAYDSGLLSGSAEGSEALNKAKAAIPPAVDEWTKYFGLELPAAPKIEFSPGDAWNSVTAPYLRRESESRGELPWTRR
ncbi:MICOS complex subunit MIC13 isoform X4 [Neoarius graeffei]|uniref:MICOS complex subunit MIC13 isoform X4 n=1 Tax=Neoarius graeffei TaxID=443677 RepID=UPI00298D0465|nr:MICOS complex subunit MIC13 isoform X4 [Neoarius graeffei]